MSWWYCSQEGPPVAGGVTMGYALCEGGGRGLRTPAALGAVQGARSCCSCGGNGVSDGAKYPSHGRATVGGGAPRPPVLEPPEEEPEPESGTPQPRPWPRPRELCRRHVMLTANEVEQLAPF